MEININIKDSSQTSIEKPELSQEPLSDAGAPNFLSDNGGIDSYDSSEAMDAGPPSQELLTEIETYENQQTKSKAEHNDYVSSIPAEDSDVTDAGGAPD